MNAFTVYQCIPCYRPAAIVRLIGVLLKTDSRILLDIEDSIQDVQVPALTPHMKASARKDLASIVQAFPGQKFHVRINSVSGPEYELDRDMLQAIGDSFESVFLPKVESAADLDIFCSDFGNRFRLNIIVETHSGITNLDQILKSRHKANIEHVFFGNYDYHLDTGTYPIVEQHSPGYWETVRPIIEKAEAQGIKFGNSPYVNIADTGCIASAIHHLRGLCRRKFALVSLHRTQTAFMLAYRHGPALGNMTYPERELNACTSELFRGQRLKGRSFAINNHQIITPQEYLLMEMHNG